MQQSVRNYYQNMNDTDLAARNCSTREDAYLRFIKGVRPMKWSEWWKLQVATMGDFITKILVFDNLEIENGFPHTHEDTIFLPTTVFAKSAEYLCSIIQHEKIHLVQKQKPFETNKVLLEQKNMQVSHFDWDENGRRRSNPDINRIIYTDTDGSTISSQFTTDAKTLGDIEDVRDHPYEMMAYGRV